MEECHLRLSARVFLPGQMDFTCCGTYFVVLGHKEE